MPERFVSMAYWSGASFLANRVHVRYTLSPVRLSSVCLSVTLVHPTQEVEIFGNISTAMSLTSTENFTEIVPVETLRRGS